MASIKTFSLGGLDKKSNDLTRSPDKASDILNMEYDTQSTLKKRNGFELFSNESCDDMVYYNSKDEFMLFSDGSSNVVILNGDNTLSKTLPLPSGISALSNTSISYCENQNNLYFTNTDYNTYVMKYDGSNIYRSGLPTPRKSQAPVSGLVQPDLYPTLTGGLTTGYCRMFYSYKDINGNITYSPYVQLGTDLSGSFPTGGTTLEINSLATDLNCAENGFFNKYCYRLKYTTWILDSTSRTLPVTRHNYVAGDKFLMDTENLYIDISLSKSYLILDVESVENNLLTASFTAAISGTTMTVSAIPSGVIKVGSKINATGITSNTYVVSFLGGSGGIGTYTVNNSQSLTSRAMTQTTNSITFTSASIDGYSISLFAGSSAYSLEYPVDVRTKIHIAVSSNKFSNYIISFVYVVDNGLSTNSILFTKIEEVLWKGLPLVNNFEDVYDSTTLKTMPPICKYISSYGDQIIYGAVQSFFTTYTNLLNNPNQLINYANNDLIIYSDISTGDGPENVSELNNQKIGETFDGEITGLRRCNDSLVIFKNRGVFTIDGALVSGEYQLRKINTNFAGCTSHKSILQSDEGVYFQAHNGLYFTNGIGVTKLTYEIDSIFNSAEYVNTRSVRLKKKQKSIFYVPELNKTIVVDYYYNQVYIWNGITASNGFVENSVGDVFFSNGTKIYKFNNSYSDNGIAINSYYSTTWHHAGEPSLAKKWLSIRTFALTNDIFTMQLSTQGDWNTTQLTSNSLSFGISDQTKFTMLDMQTKRSLRFIFSNNVVNENMVLTGYEITFEVFNNVDKN